MKKKVLFFLESLSGGGAEKVLTDIVSNLNSQKYDITVCTVTDGGIYQKKVSEYSHYYSFLKVSDYKSRGVRKLIYWLKMKMIYMLPPVLVYSWLIQGSYDVEVAFIEGFATKLLAASSNRKSKKIAWVHIDLQKNSYADLNYKNEKEHCKTYRKYDSIVCVSESVKKSFVEKFFDSKEVRVLYNPIDCVNIKRMADVPVDLKVDSAIQLVTVGRLEQQKGYMRLAECIYRLSEQGHPFTLWVLGEGSQRKMLEDYIEKHCLENRIKLIGFQENPYKYMSKCDAFICSSYAEGFSTAATESLILGVPVFTLDCAGMEELFDGKKCGEIFPNSDEALYLMLESIISGKMKLSDYKEAVLARAADYDIKKQMGKIEALIG